MTIRWVEGDARTFQLNQQFGLILDTGPVIQHVFERANQEAILAQVRDHLAPDGRMS